jgi:hypothetical protein
MSKWQERGKNEDGQVKRIVWEGTTVMLFWSKFPWWKRKCEMACYHDAAASSFVAKVWRELAHVHTVAVKCHSSMRNWLFGLPGRILCEHSPWCQRKWWASSWRCSSNVSYFLVCHEPCTSFKHPCTAHAFFSKSLSNHCQGLHRTFSEICTRFYAHSLLYPLLNHIRPDT